jgi:methylenetetrahydrofolate reductase (NADPH)
MALFSRTKHKELTPDQRQAIGALVEAPRYELIPLSNIRDKAEGLPPKSFVTVTASPKHGMETTLDVSEWLAARGHDVTPHFSAHMVRDKAHLRELVGRAKNGGMTRVFVVGGDATPGAEYEFHQGLDLIRALVEMDHPFTEIGVPSYPEGHPDIKDDVLMQVLREKQQYAAWTATQMSFNPGACETWVKKIRSEGITLPVYLGIPGVVELTKLMTIAARIGAADSARYLKKNPSLVGHIMKGGSFGPDAFLEALAPTLADPSSKVSALHVFTFNEVTGSAEWRDKMKERLAEA